jgi:hypothetical protein
MESAAVRGDDAIDLAPLDQPIVNYHGGDSANVANFGERIAIQQYHVSRLASFNRALDVFAAEKPRRIDGRRLKGFECA